jgi:hypothetical protein
MLKQSTASRVGEEASITQVVEPDSYLIVARGTGEGMSGPYSLSVSQSRELLSSFDGSSTDGWSTDLGQADNPAYGGTTGGENDGYLSLDPPDDNVTSYYMAPIYFLGDWRAFSSISVDLWSSGGDYYREEYEARGDIYLANVGLTAYLYLPHRPADDWETFVIPLKDDGDWILGPGTRSLQDVLANVTEFHIRAEYGLGSDRSGLDNVRLEE